MPGKHVRAKHDPWTTPMLYRSNEVAIGIETSESTNGQMTCNIDGTNP